MNTLVSALSQAIKVANEPNPDNFDAVSLYIYEDGTFEIGPRTYSNVITCSPALYGSSQKDMYILTVPKNAYPAWDKWPFRLLEFCSYYAIPVSSYEPTDIMGKVRSRAARAI